jgi:capsular exopolysaccharide synthesis family protein
MRPFDYLRILQRRWWVPILGLLVGLVLAFATQPSQETVLRATAPTIQYRAQHLLISNANSTDRAGQVIGFDRLALLTVTGPVRDAALRELGAQGWPRVIESAPKDPTSAVTDSANSSNSAQRSRQSASDPGIPNYRRGQGSITIYGPKGLVSVAPVPDPVTGALAIVATGSRINAPQAANVFASQLKRYINRLNTTTYNDHIAQLQTDLRLAQLEAAGLAAQLADPAVQADPIRLGALQSRAGAADSHVDQVNSDLSAAKVQGPAKPQLSTLESASQDRVELLRSAGGTTLSSSQRLIVGGAVGLLLGIVLLVVMELLGARIRDVGSAEGAARMPVIAEIPVVKMNRAERFAVATASDPASLTAEAYRSLRTSLLAMWQRHPRNVASGTESSPTHESGRGRPLRSLLVTSPGPAEGKSISVVNLAAAFAETGMTVLIIDADFRRPTQYRYLDRPSSPNLGDLDITCTVQDLDAVLQDTDVPGVRLAASAQSRAEPGHAIAVAKSAARVGQELADIVIVDSPPLLLANDASDIALGVDASILLARAGWTRRSGIVSSADLLRRLEAPVIGLVIVGAEHGVRAGYYGYYGYYGYGYGYAHPGEVSIMARLLPWKAARKPAGGKGGATSGTSQKRGASATLLPQHPDEARTDGDDPWV